VANCKYCGKDAGWLRDFHQECKSRAEMIEAQQAADAKSEILATLSRGERYALDGARRCIPKDVHRRRSGLPVATHRHRASRPRAEAGGPSRLHTRN
jgi:hypothetical protein